MANEFDDTQSFQEGWGVFDAGFRLEIQRLDNPADAIEGGSSEPLFESDEKALEFVQAEAEKGSAYHQSALQLVEAPYETQ